MDLEVLRSMMIFLIIDNFTFLRETFAFRFYVSLICLLYRTTPRLATNPRSSTSLDIMGM